MRALFSVTFTAHRDCDACETCAKRAATMARVTGSIGATHSDGTHKATVHRDVFDGLQEAIARHPAGKRRPV